MPEDKLGRGLRQRMQSAHDGDMIRVNISVVGELALELADDVDEIPGLDEPTESFAMAAESMGRESMVQTLKTRAVKQQSGVIHMLQSFSDDVDALHEFSPAAIAQPSLDSFWINNSLGATISRQALEELQKREDVLHIEIDRNVDIDELLDKPKKGVAKKSIIKKSAAKKSAAKKRTATKNVKKLVKKKTPKATKANRKKVSNRIRVLEGVPGSIVDELHVMDTGDVVIGDADNITPNTWSVEILNAPRLWEMGINGNGILVAVIDTGVNYNHPDLANRMWNGGANFPHHGFDFANNDNDPMDRHPRGHGTCSAGQVAGDGSSGLRTGVAPGARIMAIRVGGLEENTWRGMQFAITHGANVISMSMTRKHDRSPNYPAWRRATESILAAGILHANSSGNQGQDLVRLPIPNNIGAPGNCPPPRIHPLQSAGGLASTVSCGATNDIDELAGFSGRGPSAWESPPYIDYPYNNGAQQGLIKPDICAPGDGTQSCNFRYFDGNTVDEPYVPFNGTSASTPHVAGCMALLAQACQRTGKPIVPARVQEAIENTAVRIARQIVDKQNHFGAGRIDVYEAFKYGQARDWWG